MKKYLPFIKEFTKRADIPLLLVAFACSIYGLVAISSATQSYVNSAQYTIVQILAIFIGLGVFVFMTVLDAEILADKWGWLVLFNILIMFSLIPFGVTSATGNKGWLRFLGIGLQPSEVAKIAYIIVMAKHITYLKKRNELHKFKSVLTLLGHFMAMFALIILTSEDLGSALVYFFIFITMLFAAGFKIYWFLAGFASIAVVTPLLWNNFLKPYQRNRILAPYDPTIDPKNDGINWQPYISKLGLASGRLKGTGYGQGQQSQSNALFGKHTDFIFAVIGEEFGMIGCLIVFALLITLIIRCIIVGARANDDLGTLICFGVAGTLIFQTFENIGMCIGIAPVIGITLPFFSYGGSSIVSMYAAIGLVSGVKYKPKPKLFRYSYIS
ncbi:MAG: rod shape-determining protein RodA [Clostridiales bacterium]|jgi:rod shape determining protein RodA|nr:rod shape-determining protein RodA [Clostridiales bacterium]